MPKVFVIQNPVAGTHNPDKVQRMIQSYLVEKDWEHDIHQTRQGEDVAEIVRGAVRQGYDLFLAVGGDGTVSMVATGLKDSSHPMAIIPAGTGNGIARELKVPLGLRDAVALLDDLDSVRMLDAMEVEGAYYLLNFSVGLTPLALKESKREQKRKLGMLAYLLAGVKAFIGIQPVFYQLEIDGDKKNFRASEVMLMNSFTLAETGRFLGLNIQVDDGVLDLFVIEARTVGDYLRVFWNLILRKTQNDPDVDRMEVKQSLVIRARRWLEVQADGDLVGYTPVRVDLIPQAVKVIAPQEGQSAINIGEEFRRLVGM